MTTSHPTTDLTVPLTQKAAIVENFGDSVKIAERPVVQASDLKVGEVLVKILYSGVCHTDVHIAQGSLGNPPIKPFIGGHEGSGVIVAIGEGSHTQLKVGQAVGISWTSKSCLACEACLRGNESMCPSVKCSGFSVEGTFQQYVVSHATHITPIPESLPLYAAAPILCAGISVYGALKQSNTAPGDIVVVTGAGGGLGHLAIQYAINAFNLRVIAVDTGDNKRELCLKLGAEVFIDFKANVTRCSGRSQTSCRWSGLTRRSGSKQCAQFIRGCSRVSAPPWNTLGSRGWPRERAQLGYAHGHFSLHHCQGCCQWE
ncbi:hypothetical protein ACGC1H_007450 [Rhizoctonia solani]